VSKSFLPEKGVRYIANNIISHFLPLKVGHLSRFLAIDICKFPDIYRADTFGGCVPQNN